MIGSWAGETNRSFELATARGSHPLVGISNRSWFATTRDIADTPRGRFFGKCIDDETW